MSRLSVWKKPLLAAILLFSFSRLLYSVAVYNPVRTPSLSGDFQASYAEAAHWKQTGQFKLMAFTNVPYPPFFYWWIFPLTAVPYATLSAILYAAQFLLFPWAFALLAKSAAPDSRLRTADLLACALLAINFQPFLETLSTHKVEGMELFLIALAIFAFKRGKDPLAGALIFLAAGLKYLPGILALYFLWKREWRAAAGFFTAGFLCWAAFAFSFGLHAAWDLGIRQTLWVGFHPEAESNRLMANFEWQSLSEVIHRLFAQPVSWRLLGERLSAAQALAVSLPRSAALLENLLKGILLAGFLFLTRRPYPRAQRASLWPLFLLEISLALLMMPVLLQAFRTHYGILLLPAVFFAGFLILADWERGGAAEKILFAAGYALSATLVPGGLLNKLPAVSSFGGPYSRLYEWWSLPFYGYILLAAAVLILHKRFQGALLKK